MGVQDDVAALRDAVRSLERASAAVVRQLGDSPNSIDAQRLSVDVERVRQDVDLLCGEDRPVAAPVRLQVIDDTAYPQDFWMDSEDEGLGGGR